MAEQTNDSAPIKKKKRGPSPESLRHEQIIRDETKDVVIPEDYALTRRGVNSLADGIRISDSPFWVSCLVCSERGQDWMPVLRGFNRSGELIRSSRAVLI
jgi:hypothetical protein